MTGGTGISFFWSRAFLTSPWILWALFITNFLGTIYGYIWYGQQLIFTWEEYPSWFVIFVPDSPTASLFYTLTILYLIVDRYRGKANDATPSSSFRGFIEAFGVVTSVKYGVWAVVIIFWAAAKGDTLEWQSWMLTISHLAMAVEALLFLPFLRFRLLPFLWVGVWTLLNDFMDYSQAIYPWLPDELESTVDQVQKFTVIWSFVTLLLVGLLQFSFKKKNKF